MTHTIVESGSYKISRRANRRFRAYLGSCVGLYLYDTEANVGGLFHILLSEAPEMIDEERRKFYASSGIPRFLDELYRYGARPAKMRAVIAGGSLFASDSMMDLTLNLGGKTAEKVRTMLKDTGIRIEHEETGGYLNYVLMANMQDWSYTVDPGIKHNFGKGPSRPKPLSSHEIEQAIERVRPIPQIAIEVIELINRNVSGMGTIADKVRSDEVLTAKLLRLCNSAFINPGRKVDNIDEALIYLGENRILTLILSLFTEFFFKDNGNGYSLCRGGLHYHALKTAALAERLSKTTGRSLPTIAYTAGLLHDIGKAVLDQYMAASYPLFYRRVLERGEALTRTEKDVFGVNHVEIGQRLAEKWSLPENLTEAIACHHNPEQAHYNKDLACLVFLADLLMSRFQTRYELERLNTDQLQSCLSRLRMNSEDLAPLLTKLDWNDSIGEDIDRTVKEPA